MPASPETLAKHPFLAEVAPETVAALAARARLIEAEAGQLLVATEDPSTDVFLVLSGRVRICLRTASGREVILADVAEGGLIGEVAAVDGRPRSAFLAALSRAVLAVLPADAFLNLVETTPAVCRRLLGIFAARLRAVTERLMEHDTLPARHRLHAELLRLARLRAGGAPGLAIRPPPTGTELAARIGTRREAVSRELADLARQGLVETRRGALVLRDPEALRAAVAAALSEPRQ